MSQYVFQKMYRTKKRYFEYDNSVIYNNITIILKELY